MKQYIIPTLLACSAGTLGFCAMVLYETVREQGDMQFSMGEMQAAITANARSIGAHSAMLEELMTSPDPHGITMQFDSHLRRYMLEDNLYDWYSDLAGIRRRMERGEELSRDDSDWEILGQLFLDGCRELRDQRLAICSELSDVLQ